MAIKITTFELKNWNTDTFTYECPDQARTSLTSCLQALMNLGYTLVLTHGKQEPNTRTFIAQHDTLPNRQVVVNWVD